MSRITAIIILLIFSAFFSATETAFTSVNRIRIKNMANDGNKRAARVLALTEKFDSVLSTILVGNNIVNLAMSAIAAVLFIEMFPKYGATVSTVIITVVVLIFGEISPKSIAKEKAESFAMLSAPVLSVLMTVLTPVNALFSLWKKLLAKVFRFKSNSSYTEDELLTIVEEAETGGSLNESQSELIQNAIEFNDLEAKDVLTPRVDMVAIEAGTDKQTIAGIFLESGFTRIPVYEDDLDNIVGVLNQKDFHNYIKDTDVAVSEYVKPVIFVAASMKLSQLLKRLQKSKSHIAVIVDEYGGTEGLVTMEDIIEELVGEIYDEHDQDESEDMILLPDGSWRILSGTNLDKMFACFDVEESMPVNTVNGWVMFELDKLPAVGDKFRYEADYKIFDVTVTKADGRKSLEINLRVTELPREI